MDNSDRKRISRITGLLTLLQSKRMVTSTMLAKNFGVSVRTIYRDIKTLEQAGVPVITEDGKGYSLMEGYRIPPVMFTETEANALVTMEQLVLNNGDGSLIAAYSEAVSKIKAVLLYSTRDKVELLANRIAVSPATPKTSTSSSLTIIQNALTSFRVLNITYRSAYKEERTDRKVEPFALYYTQQESWALIAFCRLRKEFRMFSLDRILKIESIDGVFKPHELTLATFLADKEKNFKHP